MKTFTSFLCMLLAVICLIAPLTHAAKISYGASVSNNNDDNNDGDNMDDNNNDDDNMDDNNNDYKMDDDNNDDNNTHDKMDDDNNDDDNMDDNNNDDNNDDYKMDDNNNDDDNTHDNMNDDNMDDDNNDKKNTHDNNDDDNMDDNKNEDNMDDSNNDDDNTHDKNDDDNMDDSNNYDDNTHDNNDDDNNNNDDNNDDDTADNSASPVSVLNIVAVDIHFISGDIDNQFVVYHYCSALASGLIQCAVYNGNQADARLLGTEEIIGLDAFEALSESEKHLWHSHSYAILNGLFVIPGLASEDENGVLQTIIDTYGKVVDIYDRDNKLPVGTPRLAFGIVKDGQLSEEAAAHLDAIANDGLTYHQRAENRKSLTAKAVDSGANHYLSSGTGIQYDRSTFSVNSIGDATN